MGRNSGLKLGYDNCDHSVLNRVVYGRKPSYKFYYFRSKPSQKLTKPVIDDSWRDEIIEKQPAIIASFDDPSPSTGITPNHQSPQNNNLMTPHNVSPDDNNNDNNNNSNNSISSNNMSNSNSNSGSSNSGDAVAGSDNSPCEGDTNMEGGGNITGSKKHDTVTCPGFTGKKYYKIIKMSTVGELRLSKEDETITSRTTFPLTQYVKDRKGFNGLEVIVTPKRSTTRKRKADTIDKIEYSIRSTKCCKTYNKFKESDRRCLECQSHANDIHNMCNTCTENDYVGGLGIARLPAKFYEVHSPDVACTKIKKIRDKKNSAVRNLQRRIKNLEERYDELAKDSTDADISKDENKIIANAIKSLQPFIDQKFGPSSNAGIYLKHAITALKYPVGHNGLRCPPALLNLCIYNSEKLNEQSYNALRIQYAWPTYSHMRKMLNKEFKENDDGYGPCEKSITKIAERFEASVNKPMYTAVSFDSIKVTKNGLILSNKKEDRGRILGQCRPETQAELMTLFQREAHELCSEADKEIEMKYNGKTEKDLQQDIVEHHFGHMRSNAGDSSLVDQRVIQNSETSSHFMRGMGASTRHGNVSAEAFKQQSAE